MDAYTVKVGYADGDNFAHRYASTVDVLAGSDRDARLAAVQLVCALRQHVVHVQVVSTDIVGVLI